MVKRVLKVLSGLMTALLVVLLGVVMILAVSARRSPDGISTILGLKVLSVLSGSMEPAIHTGDVILVRPLTQQDVIREGDVITFRAKDNKDMLITHRVIGIASVNGKPAAYVTKGDNNDSPDSVPITRDQILGVYRFRVPYFGYIASFIRKPVGIVLFVILPGLILIGMEFRKIWSAVSEAEKAQGASAQTGGEGRSA